MKATPLLLAGLLLSPLAAVAGDVSTAILAQGSASWDGGSIQYAEGAPELTVQQIKVEAGGELVSLPIHCHRIPLAAYVAKGSVRVVKSSGEEHLFKTGDAFIEVMGQWHKGTFVEPTELIVFYAGAKGVPLSIKQGEAPAQVCN